MKILLPTDFSRLAMIAATYAAKLAKKLKAELILLHVVHLDSPPMVLVLSKQHEIENALIEKASLDFERIVNELRSKIKGVPISYQIMTGSPIADAVEEYAMRNQIDLIVIGTRGVSGFERLGSNAVAIIRKSSKPVISVPANARFAQMKRIVYATDMENIDSELGQMLPLVSLFDASIHLLHVEPPNSPRKIETGKMNADLAARYPGQKISFHLCYDADIVEAIDGYLADVKADLLAMFPHKLSFFDRLFSKSVSREMAFHSFVPMLTMKIADQML